MSPLLLILLPAIGALLAALGRNEARRPLWLPVIGALHAVVAVALLVAPPTVEPGALLAFDAVARATLPSVSLLFLVLGVYGVGYLRARPERSNRAFVPLMLVVLGLLSAGLQARHLGLLWITTEAVTLAAVPLVHFTGTPRAFEATWKYLLVGGTGIALSLLGSFCLGYASLHGGGDGNLTFSALTAQGSALSRPWALTAWVLLLVGYGTKMGLAPMHTWKPDAYGESPGIVGALLAGGVTTVAFVALLRVRSVLGAAGQGPVADLTLTSLGLFSIGVAALFLLGTRDFKRMLAYSSVEHMGILSLAGALGRAGIAAALFHVWTNGLTKGSLFLSAGNLRRAAGSPSLDAVGGVAARTPRSAALFLAGAFAVTACPPFGPFFSELRVVGAGLAAGRAGVVAALLVGLLLAFFGISRVAFALLYGRPRWDATRAGHTSESPALLASPCLLLGASIWLGLFTPSLLVDAWSAAAAELCAAP